jgi:cation:H+ antiporter
MGLQLFYLAVGLVLIVKGGDLFVGASVRLAELLQMPRIVIGSTLVSLATTTPELVVSIMSGSRGAPGLAVGNAVGSCICNVGLILGLTAACKHLEVHVRTLRTPLMVMIGAAVLLFVLTWDLELGRWQGWFLVVIGVGYFGYDFRSHLRSSEPAAIREARAIGNEEKEPVRWVQSRPGTLAVFALGAVLVIVGSRLLVDSAVVIATAMGIPSMVIGLTVIALGTSLPELVTAVSSVRQQVSDLSVGNIFGANIANLTLIVGTASGLSEVRLSRIDQLFNLTALIGLFGWLLWFMASDRRITATSASMSVIWAARTLYSTRCIAPS